jgi:DNA-binding beta-propeller fold protein YncE
MASRTEILDELYRNLVNVRAQKVYIDALPSDARHKAAKQAAVAAEIAALLAEIGDLASPPSTDDYVVVRRASGDTIYELPLSGFGSAVLGSSATLGILTGSLTGAGTAQQGLAYNPINGFVYIPYFTSQHVAVVDPTVPRVVATIAFGTQPYDCVYVPWMQRVVCFHGVGNGGFKVFTNDTHAIQSSNTFPTNPTFKPRYTGSNNANETAQRIYGCSDFSWCSVDPVNNTVAYYQFGGGGRTCIYNPDLNEVWFVSGSNQVGCCNADTGALVRTITGLTGVAESDDDSRFIYNPVEKRIYISRQAGNQTYCINSLTGTLAATVNIQMRNGCYNSRLRSVVGIDTVAPQLIRIKNDAIAQQIPATAPGDIIFADSANRYVVCRSSPSGSLDTFIP